MPQVLTCRQSPELGAKLVREARAARRNRHSPLSRVFGMFRRDIGQELSGAGFDEAAEIVLLLRK